VFAALTLSVRAQSLHERVDSFIEAKAKTEGQVLARTSDDAEFFRRVWLDFAGTLPASGELDDFLRDPGADKRDRLLERVFAAPAYAERMAEAFHVMLMERNGENEAWRAYLVEAFQANKPWDQMVREILSPNFKDEGLRGAGFFITRRLDKVGQQEVDYPGLTRDAGRFFMGVDLQCCQCHKHLTVNDYKQVDFNGLYMAFQNLKLQAAGADKKGPTAVEGLLTKKYEFASVLGGPKAETGPRVPFGEEIAIPVLAKDQQWVEPPDAKNKTPGIPRFSPLKELSERLACAENPFFARNLANRLWFLVMGRGLVEPLDLSHSGNPASHPEVLDLLAAELVAHKFDTKWLLAELVRTRTYQRGSELPVDAKDVPEELFTVARERPLSAEQLCRAFLTATGEAPRVLEGKGWEGVEGPKYARKDFEKVFLSALANPPKEAELTVNSTLKAALFLRNNDLVLWSLRRRPGNLMDRLASVEDPGQIAESLYGSIFVRRPTSEERDAVAAFLARHADGREKAIGRYAWAMLSSIEFFTNH
jgi:hypothetical protein